MTQEFFPAVITNKDKNGAEAVLGLDMKSILKGDLFYEDKSSQTGDDMPTVLINELRMIVNRESFIRAFSSWQQNITLELLITSLPNLRFRAQGRIQITIVLRAKAKEIDQARKQAVAKYLTLRALLMAHMCEAEFSPIMDFDVLNFRLSPFKQTHALNIRRRAENIQISDPIEKKTITGLVNVNNSQKETKGSYVKHTYGWKPSFDDWSRLLSVMLGQLDPIMLLIRLRPGKYTVSKRKLMEENIRICELYLNTGKSYQLSLTQQANLLRSALSEQINSLSTAALDVGVFLLAGHEIDVSLGVIVGQSITVKAFITDDKSSLSGGFVVSPISINRAINSQYFPEKACFTDTEASCAFRIPSPPMYEISGLPMRRSRTSLSLLPNLDDEKSGGIKLCRNIHNGLTQPVYLPAADRMRHMCLFGQTGTGKSTMMESMILQDMRSGQGLAVIDPHGDMVDGILGKIPESRIDDVILFDVLDRERPLGFNLLQWRTLEQRDFIIDELYNTIDQIYDMRQTGGPMFETNMRGMLRLLMGSKTANDYKPTILEFKNCYLYESFRNWLVRRTVEESIVDFVRELEGSSGEAGLNNMSPYVTSKGLANY